MKLKRKLFQLILCVVSGVAMGCCLLFPGYGPAVFFLAIPALVIIQKKTIEKQRFWFCFAFTAGFFLASYAPAFSIYISVEPTYIAWIDLAL